MDGGRAVSSTGTVFAAFVSARVLSNGGAALPAKVAGSVRHAVHPDDVLRGPVPGPDGAEMFEAECFQLVAVDLATPFDPDAGNACRRCAAVLTDPDGSTAAAKAAEILAARRERNAARQRAARAATKQARRALAVALAGVPA